MDSVNQANIIFEDLREILLSVRHKPHIRSIKPKTWVIDEMQDKGIFKLDSEIAQDFLYSYIKEIENLIIELPDILEQQILPTPEPNPFDPSHSVSIESVKLEIKKSTEEELLHYKKELKSLLFTINERFENLGDERFSNAGFKIKLNMTNEEIACLFGLLYAENMIIHKKANGDDLTKKELASFIYKNFSSKTKDDISIKNIENNLSPNNPSSQKISELLSKLKKAVDKW